MNGSCRLRPYISGLVKASQGRVGLRSFAAVAYAFKRLQPDIESSRQSDIRHDDVNLRRIFDSVSFWRSFNSPNGRPFQRPLGLFQNRYLLEPAGFLRFAQDSKEQCQRLADRILQASSLEDLKAIPRQLDLLSDSLCRVLDLADFVRSTHPDKQFQQEAVQAYVYLWEYMNVLNTTPGLKERLEDALRNPEVTSAWNEEELSVAKNLLKDFSNSAIDLPEKDRKRFVDLSNELKQVGSDFVENVRPANPYVHFRSSQLTGMDPTLLKKYSPRAEKVALPLRQGFAHTALGSLVDETARKILYSSMRTVSKSQLHHLERLLQIRAEIARLSGFTSFAEMTLSDKMARSPEAVDSFLHALCADNAPHVTMELKKMQELKASHGNSASIQPWDVLYYQQRLDTTRQYDTRNAERISAYFSLGTVMQGLSRLFDRLYGVRLVPRELSPGEAWEPNVRRLDVVHEDEGHIAVLYCDLFERLGKSPNPAHFTLRCSRQISEAELTNPSHLDDDGMAKSVSRSTGKLHQLPTIALICDFSESSDARAPTLLSFRDVQTLFHEMGHAIHSILGRTSLQVVSGTRCATDFAELPSVLMESFAADKDVLGLFARHWEHDTPLPYELVQDVLDTQKRGQGIQTETQILYSLLDQAYHSSLPAEPAFDTTSTFYNVYDKYGTLREPRGISPQGFFSHLVEYGGTYYSYLFDRAIAGKIWRDVFQSGRQGAALSRESGEKVRSEILKWGGGRDPWKCVGGVLDNQRLTEGGKGAMKEVGRWGVYD